MKSVEGPSVRRGTQFGWNETIETVVSVYEGCVWETFARLLQLGM